MPSAKCLTAPPKKSTQQCKRTRAGHAMHLLQKPLKRVWVKIQPPGDRSVSIYQDSILGITHSQTSTPPRAMQIGMARPQRKTSLRLCSAGLGQVSFQPHAGSQQAGFSRSGWMAGWLCLLACLLACLPACVLVWSVGRKCHPEDKACRVAVIMGDCVNYDMK